MYPEIDKIMKLLPTMQPLTYKATYPRRILPPEGFTNPKYFALSLFSALSVGYKPEFQMMPHVTGLINALMQLEYKVPTYFVRSEFAQAVAQTEPPEDFKFSEIKWPLPAMMFAIPTEFSLRYFGFNVPFISVSMAVPGTYPAVLKNLPKLDEPVQNLNHIDNQVDRFITVYNVYSESTVPVDYTGSFPLTMNVSDIVNAPFEDASYFDEKMVNMPHIVPSDLPHEGPQEREFNEKVQAFVIKLMLAITARPTLVQAGGQARAEKIKHGALWADALWHPNLVGWDYRAKRSTTEHGGETGTHASPRLHWRRGFWRNQPYGPKNSLRHLIWIEPVLINAPQ